MSEPNGTLNYRVGNLERLFDRLVERVDAYGVPVLKQQFTDFKEEFQAMRDDVKWVKRTLIGSLIALSMNAILLILILTRKA